MRAYLFLLFRAQNSFVLNILFSFQQWSESRKPNRVSTETLFFEENSWENGSEWHLVMSVDHFYLYIATLEDFLRIDFPFKGYERK